MKVLTLQAKIDITEKVNKIVEREDVRFDGMPFVPWTISDLEPIFLDVERFENNPDIGRSGVTVQGQTIAIGPECFVEVTPS